MTDTRVLTAPTPKTPADVRWQQAIKRAEKHSIPADHIGGEMWSVGSASQPGKTYIVIVREGEPVSCECSGSYGQNVCQHRAAVWLQLQRAAGWAAMAEGMVGA